MPSLTPTSNNSSSSSNNNNINKTQRPTSGSGSSSTSRPVPVPRPIHTLHKPLRQQPDESEPSYSYEETSFLAQVHGPDGRILDAEEAFHQRLGAYGGAPLVGPGMNVGASAGRNQSGGGFGLAGAGAGAGPSYFSRSYGNTPTMPTPPTRPPTTVNAGGGLYGNYNSSNVPRQTSLTDSNSSAGSGSASGGGGSGSSFWRTEAVPNWNRNSRNAASSGGKGKGVINSSRTGMTGGGGNKARWTGGVGTGGWLGQSSYSPPPPQQALSSAEPGRGPGVAGGRKDHMGSYSKESLFSSSTATALTSPSPPSSSQTTRAGDGISTLLGAGASATASATGGPPKNLSKPTRQRKTSGGLTNAANAHMQGNNNYAATDPAGHNRSNKAENNDDDSASSNNDNNTANFKRMSSSFSLNSVSSTTGNKEKKDKQKAVSRKIRESRMIKMDAQFHDVDIGREVHTSDEEDDDFDYQQHVINGVGGSYNNNNSLARQQSDGTGTASASTADGSPLTDIRSNRNFVGRPLIPSTTTFVPPTFIGSPPSGYYSSTTNNNTAGASAASPFDTQFVPDNIDNQSFASTATDGTPNAARFITDNSNIIYNNSSVLYGKAGQSSIGTTSVLGSSATGISISQGGNYIIEDGGGDGSGSSRSSSGGVLFGKSTSLIFPTGVQPPSNGQFRAGSVNVSPPANDYKAHKINLLLDQCEAVRFPFKKKLMLNSLDLTAQDIPVNDLYNTSLGNTLHKLSLAGNRLSMIPPKLVVCLPMLKTLDLSQCDLHQLPERWDLKSLKRLNLSHNKLSDFPEEAMLEGLPELQDLNMYGNKVATVIVPQNPRLLSKLETLNLGYNDLAQIPDELDQITSLRTLKLMNNFLEKIPMRICDMELKTIDVSSNPVIQPPIETCERGICSMKRYYQCLRAEELNSKKALEALQSKASRQSSTSRKAASKGQRKSGGGGGGVGVGMLKKSIGLLGHGSSGRKASDESSSNQDQTSTFNRSASDLNTDAQSQFETISIQEPAREGPTSVNHLGSDALHAKSKSLSEVENKDSTFDNASTPNRSHSLEESAVAKFQTRTSSGDLKGSDFTDIAETQQITEDSLGTLPDSTAEQLSDVVDRVTVNDTLKVIFVGMAMAGKTSMIKRLIEGENAVIPKRDQRTIGVDIYEWDPKNDRRFEHIDNRIQLQDKELEEFCGDVSVKFSVWDFAGQHVYHATHQLFFSPRALYVLVWDMGATNNATRVRKGAEREATDVQGGAFSLDYSSDSSCGSESDSDDFISEEASRRADRALERDIDEKVQFWVDCIQSSAPGSAILPVASFNDMFADNDHAEAKRRCDMLKHRLLRHEERRIQGIKDRLKEYEEQNRANDEAALRLRKLLGSYIRPKFIFGNDGEDSIVRVSGLKYTGFAELTEKINNIATGRDKANYRYPIFRGHVGARIPRMRLEVLEIVRTMRDRFKVVEWGYFIGELRKLGLTHVEDISDALHFLTNIGELSYFGGILQDGGQSSRHIITKSRDSTSQTTSVTTIDRSTSADSVASEDDEDNYVRLSIDASVSVMETNEDGSISTLGDPLSTGLSQFVFLNPRWLVAAVACILRHDLEREIQETRRSLLYGQQQASRGDSFHEANMNCPVITAEDACMLWQAKKFTKKAAERAEEYSNNMTLKPFEFLQLLLIKFGVFVPIDLGIDKAFLGGVEYARNASFTSESTKDELTMTQYAVKTNLDATYFFLPSLLGPGEPSEAWTYKSTDSWKATLCHSTLFPDGVPPGLMERIMASVLSNLYAMAHKNQSAIAQGMDGIHYPAYEGEIAVKEVLCWRTAFLVKIGMRMGSDTKESIVEIFSALVDKESHACVGSDFMSIGSRRLVVSAKGQEGDGGRKIWYGGLIIVLKAVQLVMEEYGGLEFERQVFCPHCLSSKAVGEARYWDISIIRQAIKNGETFMRCSHGHKVDTRLVVGPYASVQSNITNVPGGSNPIPTVAINDLLRAVVLVGLWDGRTQKVVRVGSGFIADKKRGLIVTAAHTLMNIWGDKATPFGENYYGLRQGKVVIGVIPHKKGEDVGTEAVFRYFAKIVAKDPSIDKGFCELDACILQITTRMENDVGGTGDGCGEEPERLLLNNPHALEQEKLHRLKITDKCELDEQVRIVGFNQGGEGLMGPGVSLNRYVDFARGYVCKKFAGGEGTGDSSNNNQQQIRHRFKPREEIVVICPTIGGHSGGPCVNQQGEVVGILSRADPAEKTRCMLAPATEWKKLLKQVTKQVKHATGY